jgi:hypothetical protein
LVSSTLLGLMARYYYSSTVTVLFLWGALSEERIEPSFSKTFTGNNPSFNKTFTGN